MQLSLVDSPHKLYLIDTSGLIQLDRVFPKDAPAFSEVWMEMEDMIKNGQLKTLSFVEEEINSYEGAHTFLKDWVKDHRHDFVVDPDEGCYNTAIPIINDEYSTGFFDSKKLAEGKDEADPYLIAYCKLHRGILVTNESPLKHNKIPAVAKKHGVQCMAINDFLSQRGLKMVRKRKEYQSD